MKLCLQREGLSRCYCRHTKHSLCSRGFTPLCFSTMCVLCCKAKRSRLSGGILPRVASGARPPVAPRWCGAWQACSVLLPSPPNPAAPTLALPHSSPRGDAAALIDNNGNWQDRWETREGRACEILPELPVTDQGLWHHSPVIPPAPGLGPVTAGSAWRERRRTRHRH